MSRHTLHPQGPGRYSRELQLQREKQRLARRRNIDDSRYLGSHVAKGSKLHGRLAGRPCVVMGNAYSLNKQDLEKLFAFPVIGCNRCLEMPHHPDFYTVVDRAPYIEQLDRIRKYKGIRVLSETLFDPGVSCRRTRVQQAPNFSWYRYRAVASSTPFPKGTLDSVFTFYCNDNKVTRGRLPSVQTNLDEFMPSGANIAYCMLQIAMAMGANPIGICGVDLTWGKDKTKTHFFGEGKKRGAFPFNTKRVLSFFAAAAQFAKHSGVKIYNLSPEGALSPTFERIDEKAFHRRFAKYTNGDRVRPWQFVQFEPDKGLRLSGTGMHGRSKQDIKDYYAGVASDSRPRRNRAGSPANKPKSRGAAPAQGRYDRHKKAPAARKRRSR
jgi:hypothetical protein